MLATAPDDDPIVAFREAVRVHPQAQPYADGTRASDLYARMNRFPRIARRYLAARHGDVPAAAQMFVETLRWRDAEGIDGLLGQPNAWIAEVATLINEGYPHGVDVDGRPIMVHEVARVDVAAVLKSFTFDQCLRYVVHWMEFRTRFLLSDDETDDADGAAEFVAILNMDGMRLLSSMGTLLSFLRATFGISQSHYPETMGRTVVIHAGRIFSTLWAVVRRVLHPRTQEKVVVCADAGRSQLLALVGNDPTKLPTGLGGTCTCGCDGKRAWAVYLEVCRRGVDALGGFDTVRARVRRAFGLCGPETSHEPPTKPLPMVNKRMRITLPDPSDFLRF